MITCKEDLMNTHIENDFGELRKAYIDKAIELGYDHQGNRERGLNWYNLPFIAINSRWNETYVAQVDETSQVIAPTKSKLLTLKDLEKPTPTKFVKVEESIFDLKEEFERGELYQKPEFARDYSAVSNAQALASALDGEFCYRQVETDWRDELDSYLDSMSSLDSNFDEKVTLEFSKSKFAYNLSDDEFVAVCHLVASLTEKPEGV